VKKSHRPTQRRPCPLPLPRSVSNLNCWTPSAFEAGRGSAITPAKVAIPATRPIAIDSHELVQRFARASGPGGQHVNTPDSAAMRRVDVGDPPGLPDAVSDRLAPLAGSRLTRDGVLILRSDGARSQLLNRQDARERLLALVREATIVPKKRRPTKPPRAS